MTNINSSILPKVFNKRISHHIVIECSYEILD